MGGKGGSSAPQTTTTSTSSEPPKYIAAAYKDILAKAKDVYNLPLQQYGGPQLAGFTPDQEDAFSTIRGAKDSWAPYMDTASGLVTQGTQDIWSQLPQFSAEEIAKYNNPYEDQVVGSIMDDLRRMNAQQQQDMTGNAIAAGAWGGSGADDAKMNLAYQQAQGAAGTIAGVRQQGYQSSLDQYLKEKAAQMQALTTSSGNALQGAGISAGMGAQELQNLLAQAGAQSEAGGTQQNLVQQQLNIPYEQFLQQQAFPYENLQYYANIAAALGGGAGGTTTGTGTAPGQKSSGGVGQALGTAATIASMFLKDGGRVSAPRSGIGPSSLDPEKRGGIIPTGGFTKASMGAPAAVAMPNASQPESGGSGMPDLGLLGNEFAKMFGAGDVRSIGTPDQTWDFMDNFSTGARKDATYASKGGMGPYRFADGGKVMDYRNGGKVCYADGGGVDDLDLAASGVPVAGFKPVVANTPVYAFNPLAARAAAVDIPSRIPTPAAEPAKPAEEDKSGDMMNLLGKSYINSQLAGIGKKYGNTMNWRDTDEGQGFKDFFDNYMVANNYQFADGGQVQPGILKNPRGIAGLDDAFKRENTTVLPAALQKTLGSSYIPKANAAKASLSAPGSGRLPTIATPKTPAVKDYMADGMGGGASGGFDPSVLDSIMKTGSPPFVPEEKQYDNKFDRAVSTPWRAALLSGGANMMMNPQDDVLSALGLGIATAGSTYGGMKKAERDAEKEAQSMYMEALKYRTEMDYKDQDMDIKRQELDMKKKEADRPEYDTVEGENEIMLFDKKAGTLKGTGQKPKAKASETPEVTPDDIFKIETDALMMIPGAAKEVPDGKNKTKTVVDPALYDALGPKMLEARNAASKVYQKTKDAQEGINTYLKVLGVDPAMDEYDAGADNSAMGRMMGYEADRPAGMRKTEAGKTKAIAEAKDAIAKGAPKAKVVERLKSMGIESGGL